VGSDMDDRPGMRRLTGFAVVGVSALLVACVHIASAHTTPRGALNRQVAAGNGAARDCRPEEARRLVLSFIRAFNAGDGARLESLFAADDGDGDAATPSFQWYSTGPPGQRYGRAADDRSSLIRYFAVRHTHGERLGLLSMSHGGGAPGSGYFSFGFHIHRQAHDLPRPGAFEGKGAATCVTGRPQIAVWSVGPRISAG